MLRIWVVLLCLVLAVPLVAQNPGAPATKNAVTIAAETARADKAERDFAIREAADQLEEAQTTQAYNRFEIMIGLFSALITVLVIVFGFRTEKAAARAASQEVASAKVQIDELLTAAREATAAALSAKGQAEEIKAEVDKLRQESADAVAQAKANAEESSRQMEASREAAAIIDGLKASADAGREIPMLTAAQAQKVEEAAKGIEDKPEVDWSIAEFKTRIGKAKFIDRDWPETIRLTQQMAIVHGMNDDAFVFAKNAEGDALRELFQYQDAIAVYDLAIDRAGNPPKPELEQPCIWAMHHKGVCLTCACRSAEAEAMFRELLPLCERVAGAEDSNTLVTRNELASAILDQGRAVEAETLFQELLTLYERIEGSEVSHMFVTRHELARAILNQGRAVEAETLCRELLPLWERFEGAKDSHTLATRHVLARAILDQGRDAEAEALFRKLMALCEKVDGAEHTSTLEAWQEMARAILDQRRATEAEALFRELLPLRERIDGAERSTTYVTRYWSAAAILQNGDAPAAQALLDQIPHKPDNSDWTGRWSADLAFIRSQVADALGKRADADRWLEQAAEHYAAAYPPDHFYRCRFGAHLAQRPAV